MTSDNRQDDSFLIGVAGGGAWMASVFLLLDALRGWLVNSGYKDSFLAAPKMQLYTLLFSVLLFRLLMINLKREKTARGLLLVTFAGAIMYYIYAIRIKHAY